MTRKKIVNFNHRELKPIYKEKVSVKNSFTPQMYDRMLSGKTEEQAKIGTSEKKVKISKFE